MTLLDRLSYRVIDRCHFEKPNRVPFQGEYGFAFAGGIYAEGFVRMGLEKRRFM